MTKRQIRVGPRAGTEFPVEVHTHVSVLTEFEQVQRRRLCSVSTPRFSATASSKSTAAKGRCSSPIPTGSTARSALLARCKSLSGRLSSRNGRRWSPSARKPDAAWGCLTWHATFGLEVSHIATGELGLHVLDTLIAVEESATRGEFVDCREHRGARSIPAEEFDPFEPTL